MTTPVEMFPDPILSDVLVSPSRLKDPASVPLPGRFGVYLSPSGNPQIAEIIIRHGYQRVVDRYLNPACSVYGAQFAYVWYPHRLSPEPRVWFYDTLHCSDPMNFVNAMATLPPHVERGAYLRRPYSTRVPWSEDAANEVLLAHEGLTLFFDAIFGAYDPASKWPMFESWMDRKTPSAGGEPLWNPAPDTWGWGRPCIVTEWYYQWQKARGWDLSREPVAGVPEVIRTDYGVPMPNTAGMDFGQARKAVLDVLTGFYDSCMNDGHSCCVGADLLTDYKISRTDLEANS